MQHFAFIVNFYFSLQHSFLCDIASLTT
jgi:hypothetical protein